MILINHNPALSPNCSGIGRDNLQNFLDYWNRKLIAREVKEISWNINHYVGPIELSEMAVIDGTTTSTYNQTYGGYLERPYNCRMIFETECIIEIESDDRELNFKGTIETCINLIKDKIHFAVFYAEGMRSPHIRIYDLLPLNLTSIEARTARKRFTLMYVPMKYHGVIDTSLFSRHKICLEFADHYKYNTPLNLLFEYGAGK